jgi:hypothetical protein
MERPEHDACRGRTPDEESAVAESTAKRACPCWRDEGPYRDGTCLNQYYGLCKVTHETWMSKTKSKEIR